MNINISDNLQSKNLEIALACVTADVVVHNFNEQLWEEINKTAAHIKKGTKLEEINKIPAIAASRHAYKMIGKDPSRYRLSAEALRRRILNDKELYQINNVVDIINFTSIATGFSIGGYDSQKIEGSIVFDIGKAGELYEAIGRGSFNIEGLPVFRDSKSAFGSPTSDSERTKISKETRNILLIIISFNGEEGLANASDFISVLLTKYADAQNVKASLIK